VPELQTDDVRLHVEVDGAGEPVTVLAHGLTNSCTELAAFTPMVPGTKVRFCFRGHGHSSVAPAGAYRFADLARDLLAVADAYGATGAVGTSMGAGAITHVLGESPDRFERVVFLLPAALDVPLVEHEGYDRTARILETLEKEQAIEAILSDPDRAQLYVQAPWLRELDMVMWQDMNPIGLARAIREVVRDTAIADRELLRKVQVPVLLICREDDSIHPADLGRALADLLPRSELIVLASDQELMVSIPMLVERVSAFLVGDS
jgi:pimeloyl-ACP methyl ester carboxylesterase